MGSLLDEEPSMALPVIISLLEQML